MATAEMHITVSDMPVVLDRINGARNLVVKLWDENHALCQTVSDARVILDEIDCECRAWSPVAGEFMRDDCARCRLLGLLVLPDPFGAS